MELRHLHYFLKIAETSSFTRAAAALRVTQPTLSHQINQLETEIGKRLFDRAGRQVRLTEPGSVFQVHAQRALKELEAGVNALRELDGLIRGKLTVGVFRTFSSSPLPAVLAEFSRRYPGVQVTLRQLSLKDIERELIEGSMNLAVAYLPSISEKIETVPLHAVPLALVSNSRHPLYGRKSVSIRDLHGQQLVLLSQEFPLRQLIDQCLARHGVVPRVVMEMNSSDAVLSTLRSGPLAAILTARALGKTDTLWSVELKERELARTAAIFWSRDSYRSAATLVLAKMVQRAYGAGRGGKNRQPSTSR